MPIKVLQIQPKYNVQISDPQEQIISALSGNEFDVTAAFLTGTPKQGETLPSCKKVKYFNFPKKKLKGLRLLATFQVWKYCQKQQFDIIITHRFKPLNIFLIVNKLLSKPSQCISVIHANGEFERIYRRFITYFLADKHWKFVGVSKAVKEDLLKSINAGLTEQNVTYINNALDIKKTSSALLAISSARKTLGINPSSFVFGTIGRLVTIKGHFYLLDAFKQVLINTPSAKLVIMGGGELEDKMRDYLYKNKMETSVILTGNLPNAYRFLPALDVFVLTSLNEAFGLVLLEAMIAKVPIIATNVGGIKYVLANKGKLIPPANVKSLAISMEEHMNLNKQQLQSLGEGLYKRAEKKFSIEQYRNNFMRLVRDFYQLR